MSTKTTSSNQLQFDPQSKNVFSQYQATAAPVLQQLGAQPFNNPFFNYQKSAYNNQAVGLGARNMAAQNAQAQQSGLGNMSGFLQSAMGRQARGTSALQAQGLTSAMNQANQNQLFSLGTMSAFQPLMTGSNSQQQTSGLGTWLPQLLSAGIGAATAGMTGGASLAAGGAFKGLGGLTSSGGLSSIMNSSPLSAYSMTGGSPLSNLSSGYFSNLGGGGSSSNSLANAFLVPGLH